jgi:protein disulfide-isomerase A1
MASPRALFLALLAISALLFVNLVHCTEGEEDDDIAFLSQDDAEEAHPHLPQHDGFGSDADLDESESDLPQFDAEEDEEEVAKFDESHVVILTDGNFSSFISKNKHVMVEFYAPWCGQCKMLTPEYAAAAKDLAEEGAEVALAKVDATEESDLSQKYDIQGFPTVLFFIDGVRLEYSGGRNR